ncbi:MAG: ABC-F family ATP-binding cassette domain-containing protein, partial [Deltaproteobacteria bacterium]|nr:ABC-F family ATP-binding cassette domain-containing protein [Deltaproteobacteria bacterium]
DEPTNYLDIIAVRWLQRFLKEWPEELMLITHDREFMDSVTTHTLGIHRQRVKKLAGGTAKYYEQIIQEEEIYEKTRQNEIRERKEIEKFVNRFRAQASKARLVQSRVKLLDKMEVKTELNDIQDLEFRFRSKPFPGKFIAHVNDLRFGYNPEEPLIDGLSFSIGKNDRIAVIGPNGKGKTTLLTLLAQERKPDAGAVTYSSNAELAYFGQTNISRLTMDNTVEEEVIAAHADKNRAIARSVAGLMMFEGDQALKKIRYLSGGERSRVLLGKILLTPSNFLLLDEPTNHLDMQSIESLLEAVEEFEGAVVLVTHSDEILRRVPNRLVVFDRGKVSLFEGTYEDFLRRVGWADEEEQGIAPEKPAKKSREEIKKIKREMERCEKEIETVESRVKSLEIDLQKAIDASDSWKISDISAEIGSAQKEIESKFRELESLDSQIQGE